MVGLLISAPISKISNVTYYACLRSIVESIGEQNIVLIDCNYTERNSKMIGYKKLKTIHIPWIDGNNWIDYEKRIAESIPSEIDTLITFSNATFRAFKLSNTSMIDGFEIAYSKGNYSYSCSFEQTRSILSKYKIVKYCVEKNIKLIHFAIDPQEFDYAQYFKTGQTVYFMNKDYMKYVPSYEQFIFKQGIYVGKKYDFTFYATATSNDRKYLADSIDSLRSIPNSNVNVYTNKSDDLLPQAKYHRLIAKSKFTLVIPSYDVTAFSMIRFFESVANYCLPLILDTCDLTDLKNTFPDIYEFAKKYLIVSIDEIKDRVNELDYDKLITELYQTKTIKHFFDKDFLKGAWDKYL